ncbi:hypothetical protein [Nonomuraea sp. NPDC052265]
MTRHDTTTADGQRRRPTGRPGRLGCEAGGLPGRPRRKVGGR